jgi:hypothetical protein
MDSQAFELMMEQIRDLKRDIEDIRTDHGQKLDLILQWKWKLVGGTLVVSAGITLAIQLASILIK